MSVQRFDSDHSLAPFDDGAYVRYEDYAKLEKALEQAIDAGSLAVVTVVQDKGYGMWRYEGVECIVGGSATENFFAGYIEDYPELAAYLRGKEDNR